MVRVFTKIFTAGQCFSPADAERALGVTFELANEPGARGRSGRILDDGAAWLRIGPPEGAPTLSAATASEAVARLDALRTLGASDPTIHVDVEYDGQCNLELEPDVLGILASSGATLALSVYPTPGGDAPTRARVRGEDEPGDAC